jgi:hypothetical protein
MKGSGLNRKSFFIAATFALAIGNLFGQTQTFTSNGTFTVPVGVNSIVVECWGSGGGGGSSNTNGGGSRAGGGGGGGGYSYLVIAVTPGNTYNIVVGTGGAGGNNGNGANGSSSTFNATTVVANGGRGGGQGGNGALGAGAVAGTGSTVYTGGNGAAGVNGTGSGGGGGGAGSTGNGGNASGMTAGTGTSTNGGNGGAGRSGASSAGNNGNTYGGGGSGGFAAASGGDRLGGNGSNGLVVINWVQPFYSQNSGDPSVLTNWNTLPGGGGSSPLNFTTNNQLFVIQSGHTMTTSGSGWTISGNGTKVQIQSGGILTETTAITVSANTTLQVDNGGILNHNVNSVTIFGGTESFGNISTVNFGFSGAQNVVTGTYGNLTLSGSGAKTIPAATVNGILSLEGTATATAVLTYGANSTIQYRGSAAQVTGFELPATFNGTGGIILDNPSGVTLSASLTIGSTLNLLNGSFNVGAYILTLNGPTIAGTPSNLVTGATSSLVFGGTTAGVLIPASVVSLSGLSVTNTNIVTLQSSPTIAGVFNPGGAGLSIGANTLTINGQVNCGTILGGATSNIIIGPSGSGASLSGVTLNNLTVNRAVSLCGNVTVGGTLTLTSGALSIGAFTLSLSNGSALTYGVGSLTGGVTSNLTIGTGADITLNAVSGGLNNLNTSRNITLGADLSLNGTLSLTAGTFTVSNRILTLNGPTIAGTPANLSTTAASSLVFGGTTAGVLIPTSVVALNGLSITNTSIVTLQSSLTISGTFNPTGAGLSIGANTLTLNGQVNCGTLTGGATSNIIIGPSGSGASLSGVTLNNLTLNRAVSLCGNVTVGGTLSLTSGALTIGANTLTLSNGGTLTYGGGSLTGGVTSNITIGTGSDITLNAVSGGLNNFSTSRNIILGADLLLNGTLTLTAGTFTVSNRILTLNGPTIAGTPSNLLTGATSSLVYGGSSAGVNIPSSVVNLNNLIINNANGVTMNSNITLAAGGVLTLSNGILQAGTYFLKILNTSAAAAIAWTSGSFVNLTTGWVERTLLPNLVVTGNNYLFPVGDGGNFKGINLTDVNTGATGPVLRASVASSGALTGDGSTISSVFPRYWSLINVNGGNLTSAKVELYESGLDFSKTIGMSSAVAGNYSGIGGSSNTSSVTSATVLNPGPYFCIGSSLAHIFYSYQTGSWNTPGTWTSDPSGTTQVGNTVPGNSDKVFILSGRTVTLPANIATSTLDITIDPGGFLDQGLFRFNSGIYALRGSGTIKLASASFPAPVIVNTFVTTDGGTTEYNAGVTLPAAQAVYYHLVVRAAGTVIQKSNITLNGNLSIKQGIYQINDATAQRLQLIINGNVTVDNGTSFTVGTGVTNSVTNPLGINGTTGGFINYYELHSHRIQIFGDFTNNGTVRFTNLSYPVFNSFPPTVNGATTGFATVYFNGPADRTLTCNGQTDFYNLILDKGTDQTFKLVINSAAYNYFRIFGANTAPGDNTAPATNANPNLRKALWVRNGTLDLQGLVVIPSLSEGATAGPPSSDFTIPGQAAIILNGAGVIVLSTADDYREVNGAYGVAAPDNATMGINTAAGNSGLSVLGKLQITDGYLSTRESAGILYWTYAPGQFMMNGGTIDTKQFHSSSLANSLISYTQTSGTMLLRGRFQRTTSTFTPAGLASAPLNNIRAVGGIDATAGSFSITNSGGANGFSMSGGTIRIFDVCGTAAPTYAFQVLCSASDINVSGGTVEILPTSGTVPANDADYLINSAAPFGNLIINRASGTTSVQLNSSPITVINNLTLTSGVLTANNLDVTVGGDLTIANGTTYNPGTNTTTLNGSAVQNFFIYAAQNLNNLTLNKTAGIAVNFAGNSGTVVNIANNLRIVLGTLNDYGNTLNVAGSLYNSGIAAGAGKISLNGTSAQTIDGNGIYGNIELNNTNAAAAPVSLLAGMTINGNLTFLQNKIFNIGTYNLKLNGSAAIINGGTLRYIQSAGNNGDGGVTKVFSATGAFQFPIGVANYTPATITLNSLPAVFGSVTVIPVNYAHPNVTVTGRSLSYYWHVLSAGFTLGTGTVTHSYNYAEANVVTGAGITENEYIPARFNNTTSTWSTGALNDMDISGNVLGDPNPGSFLTNVSFIDGDYTAGDNNPVSPFGTPRTLYSRQNGLWSNVSSWSLTSHTVNNPPATVPGANDIVIIGGNDSIYLTTNSTTENTGSVSCATLQIERGSALDVGFNPSSNFARVVNHQNGNGNFRVTTDFDSPSTFIFPSGDFSDFNINRGTTELYTTNSGSGTEYYMPVGVSSYGNLILSPLGGSNLMFPNNNVTIYGDLITRGQNASSWFCPTWGTVYPGAVPAIAKTIRINGKLDIQGGALIWYNNGAIAQNFVVGGDVIISPLSAVYAYPGATNQTMSIGGSLINNANGNTNAPSTTQARADFGNIPLIFNGSTSASITNTIGTPLTIFNLVTVNKGTSQATTLTCNISGTLTTAANAWLTLTNGTFRYMRSNPSADFTISTTTPFTIPATAGLYVNLPSNTGNRNILIGAAANNNGDLLLQGALTLINGNVYVGRTVGTDNNNNDIEYSTSGASTIDIRGGILFVNGQIRRNPSNASGILRYRQTGGAVTVNGQAFVNTNAKFEVVNTGSVFKMTSGTLTIVRGNGANLTPSSSFGDMYVRPDSSSVTGGTIIFSNAGVGSPHNYFIDASVPLYHITISGASAANYSALRILANSLVLNGNLLINSNSVLNSNNINTTFNGNFTNNQGVTGYIPGTNTTTFSVTNGSSYTGMQSITGSTNFNNLTVNPGTSLTLNSSITVNSNLIIGSGSLICIGNSVNLKGNLTNNSSYTDNNTGGSGIFLTGTALQLISGTGSFARLTLNNPSGAETQNDIALEETLTMTAGILNIQKNLLSLGLGASISGGPFSTSKMIITDGVFSTGGLRKFFNTGATALFTFPIGTTGKYTPADLTITANSTVGYVQINNVNSRHPGVIDPANALKYFWQVQSSGVTNLAGSLVANYLQSDVSGVQENSYLAARLIVPGTTWVKTAGVDPALNTLTFNYINSSNLGGEYTAGVTGALPNNVPEYTSNSDGNWSNNLIWTQTGGDTYPCPIGGPNGFIVTVNHVVTLDANNCFAYRTTINNRLRVILPYFGHNLGTVDGNGLLYVENGSIPAGVFTSFLSCSNNSTIEYGGTGTYTIIADLFSTVPKMLFTGTGVRVLPAKDLTICSQFKIDGPTVDNSVYNKQLAIRGSMERYNTGVFVSGTGTGATVQFAGSALQTIGGALGDFTGTSAFNNLEINNPSGLTVNAGGAVEVKNNLFLTNGLIRTGPTSSLTISNPANNSVFPTGGSASSFISGPLVKKINQYDSFLFPIGTYNAGIGNIQGNRILISSTQTGPNLWSAEYINPNPTASQITAPLMAVSTQEYWNVKVAAGVQSLISINWIPSSDITPLVSGGLGNMRLSKYNTGTSRWEESGTNASGDNYNGTAVSTGLLGSTGSDDYTLASVSDLRPKAKFTPVGPVCGPAGIPVTFTSPGPIPFNYTLNYTIGGISQAPVTITPGMIPYTLPTPSSGVYILSGFTYNNGLGIGSVDVTPVTVSAIPTTASAGADQANCGVTTTTLLGNAPAVGAGLWTIINGGGGNIISPTSPTSQFFGLNGVVYTLRWTISNGLCQSTDDVIINFTVQPSPPTAPSPQSFCNVSGATVASLAATPPPACTVEWYSVASGGTPLAPGTVLANSTTYYAESRAGTCASISRTPVAVNLIPDNTITLTSAPGTDNQATCINSPIVNITYSTSGATGANVTGLPAGVGGVWAANVVTISGTPLPVGTFNYTITLTGGCGVVTRPGTITTISSATWTGSVNTNWNNPGNWSCNSLPDAQISVVIADVPNKPVLSSGAVGVVNNITIDINSSFTISGNRIQVSGIITNNGTFDATDGSLEMNGTAAQSIGAGTFAGNTIKDLIVNNAAGLTLSGTLNVSGVILAQSGNLATGGFLTLLSTAGQTALINGSGTGQVTGNVTMQRYLPSGFGYKYLSSPFQAATVSELGDDMDLGAAFPSVYRYDETRLSSGWVSYINPVNVLNPMAGYSVNFYSSPILPTTVDITGTVNNGPLSVTLYNNNRTYTRGFNLVGNPYPSPVNWNAAGWTKTNIDNALYFFKASLTDQYGGTYSSYVNGISSDGVANAIIPSMQGFFVHVSDGGYPVTGSLGFSNSVRVTNPSPPFFKSAVPAPQQLVRLTATFADDPASEDPAVIYFDEKGTEDMDFMLDALKLFNTDLNVPNLYSVNNTSGKLSISALPVMTASTYQVPLGIKVNRNGTVVFKLKDIDPGLVPGGVFLTDAVTGTQQDLLGGKQYMVSLLSGDYVDRFWLNFGSMPTTVPKIIENEKMFSAYYSKGVVKAAVKRLNDNTGIITMHNIIGKLVYTLKIYENGNYEFSPSVPDGIYILTFVSGNERYSQKLYIGGR